MGAKKPNPCPDGLIKPPPPPRPPLPLATAELATLRDRVERLEGALREVQWSGWSLQTHDCVCPACGNHAPAYRVVRPTSSEAASEAVRRAILVAMAEIGDDHAH